MPYNCLYLNKGNNSSVKGSILTKLKGYREFMVLIICTKNESNLTNRYWDMVQDRQKVRTDRRNGRTHGRRQNNIPPTSSGDNNRRMLSSKLYFEAGDFLPFSSGRISAPFPIKNSHLISQYHIRFSQLKKVKKKMFFFVLFFTFFRDHYYLWETMTHIRIILQHLC